MKIKITQAQYELLATVDIRIIDFIPNVFKLNYNERTTIDLDSIPMSLLNIVAPEIIEFFNEDLVLKNQELLAIEKERGVEDYRYKNLNKEIVDNTHTINQLKKYTTYRDNTIKETPRTLRAMFYTLRNYLDNNLTESKFLYRYNKDEDYYQPYLISDVSFTEKTERTDSESINITYSFINENSYQSAIKNIDFLTMKSAKRDPVELLKSVNFHIETNELLEEYLKIERDFIRKASMQNKQFIDESGVKYINDNVYHFERLSENSRKRETLVNFGEESLVIKAPILPKIYVYNLRTFTFEFKNIKHIEPYAYNSEIEKKLILPKEHKNLIDILLSDDMQKIGGDFIEGKGKGTLILTKGSAGLGKTATCEVFSEKKQLPMLNIHAGQLGTDEEKLEKRLRQYFDLALRWGCIILLDESDVYIRRRENDIKHNAIVATILRLIEYYDGILFMTTNRVDDVDEAIESRCTAVLSYDYPSEEMRASLWRLFARELDLNVSEDELEIITKNFKKISGRDIKNITQLVSKYTKGSGIEKATFTEYKLCATFRGMYKIGGEE